MKKCISKISLQRVIGESVRMKRRAKNLTLEKLASMTNLDDKHLGRLERGEKLPNAKTLLTLQDVLNLSSDELIPKYKKELQKFKLKMNDKNIS